MNKVCPELTEGSSIPKWVDSFDENNEYGSYGALGVDMGKLLRSPSYAAEVAGACIVTELPYNKENVQYVRGLLNSQIQLAIPETHQEWVTWIYLDPKVYLSNNPLNKPIGTVGWIYKKETNE